MLGADSVVRQGVGGFGHLVCLRGRELTIDPYTNGCARKYFCYFVGSWLGGLLGVDLGGETVPEKICLCGGRGSGPRLK